MQQLKSLGFCRFYATSPDSALAVTTDLGTTCGLYCLELEPGLFYIGQTTNLSHRLKQHARQGKIFTAFSFLPVKRHHLKIKEKYAIVEAESKRINLTNRDHSSDPDGSTALDCILSRDQQLLWLAQQTPFTISAQEREPSEISARQKNNFVKLRRHARWAEIRDIAAGYIAHCIPAPMETENRRFWCVTCLPGTTTGDLRRLFCFNINRMETFVLFHSRERNVDLYSLLIVSKSMLTRNYGSLETFKKAHPHCLCHESTYLAAGNDQLAIETADFDALSRLFASPFVVRAAKELNMHLMRKGATVYARHHNWALADALFDALPMHEPASSVSESRPNDIIQGSMTP